MTLRTIVVHADEDDAFDTRLSLAIELARKPGAKLFCVYAARPLSPLSYGEYMTADVIESLMAAERARAEGVETKCRARLAHEGLSWEWRRVDGVPETVLPAAGAIADLIVMSQAADDSASPMLAAVSLGAGRPVLCVPRFGSFAGCGRRVLVAWNGSREAARAVHDALPFLVAADSVVLFVADESPTGASVLDAAAHLAAHGVKVEVSRTSLEDLDVGTAILNAAADMNADLIVMGAYGHTRLREWILGGATRTILQSMTAPVLLSH